MALRKFIIERDIPKVGTFEREQLRQASAKSNEVLRQLGPDIQWVESFVAADKTFCVYLAKDEAIIRKHAEISGFPATKITEVKRLFGAYRFWLEPVEDTSGGLGMTTGRATCRLVATACRLRPSRPRAYSLGDGRRRDRRDVRPHGTKSAAEAQHRWR